MRNDMVWYFDLDDNGLSGHSQRVRIYGTPVLTGSGGSPATTPNANPV